MKNPNDVTSETIEQDRRSGPGPLATYAAKHQDTNARAEGRTRQLTDKIGDILDRVARTLGARPIFAKSNEDVKPINDFYDSGYTETIEIGSVVFRVGVTFRLPGILKLAITVASDYPDLGDGGCQISMQSPLGNFEKRTTSIDDLLGWIRDPHSSIMYSNYSVHEANVQIMNALGSYLAHFSHVNDMAFYPQGMVSDRSVTYVLLDQDRD